MEEINPTETLDPRRIAAKGRERRRRRQFAAVAGTAVFVLATAGTAYALSSGTSGKDAVSSAAGSSSSASATPGGSRTFASGSAAPGKAAATLPGRQLTSGTTDGVEWKVSFTLITDQGYPAACLHVWTSDGTTTPSACTVTLLYSRYGGVGDAPQLNSFQPQAISDKLGVAGISTSYATRVHVTYAGGAFDLPAVTPDGRGGPNNEISAVVLPLADTSPSGKATVIGPHGSSAAEPILIYATPTGQ